MREVDELEDDNPVSLSIERRRGRFGRLTVHWSAYGSLDDIFPTSGVVRAACIPWVFCFNCIFEKVYFELQAVLQPKSQL